MSTHHTHGLLRVKISAVLGDAWLMPASASAENRMREVGLVNDPEDARRLVACWNAFEGISTELIEALPTCGVDGLATFAGDKKRECDQLRAKLDDARTRNQANSA